jgi:hypothetical protein
LYKKPKNIFKSWCDFCKLAHTRKAGIVDNIFYWWDIQGKCIESYAKRLLPPDFDYDKISFFNPPMFTKNKN